MPGSQRHTARPRSKSASHATSVAVIEPQRLVRDGLAALVEGMPGFRVTVAVPDVDTVLGFVRRAAPQIALLAIPPRHQQALAAMRDLRRHWPTARILLLDEFPIETHLRHARRVGLAGYLTRHDSRRTLAAALARVAAGGVYFPADSTPRAKTSRRGERAAGRAGDKDELARLTRREIEVLVELAQGRTVRECADALSISPHTADNHKSRLMLKLGLHKGVDLARFAIRHGLLRE